MPEDSDNIKEVKQGIYMADRPDNERVAAFTLQDRDEDDSDE